MIFIPYKPDIPPPDAIPGKPPMPPIPPIPGNPPMPPSPPNPPGYYCYYYDGYEGVSVVVVLAPAAGDEAAAAADDLTRCTADSLTILYLSSVSWSFKILPLKINLICSAFSDVGSSHFYLSSNTVAVDAICTLKFCELAYLICT